jgi:hypothetical protein
MILPQGTKINFKGKDAHHVYSIADAATARII